MKNGYFETKQEVKQNKYNKNVIYTFKKFGKLQGKFLFENKFAVKQTKSQEKYI